MDEPLHRRIEAERFREIFRKLHAAHPSCLADEWLSAPCRTADGQPMERPIVWSRRNGAWRRVEVLWVGAAPGNAGGKGASALGAHGTRIPFGGDVAGANLDALFGSIGLSRNDTFIAAALNELPARGGGEPTPAELRAPTGAYPSSVHLLRDTMVAAGPRLIVALGNVALRVVFGAAQLDSGAIRLPTTSRLGRAGLERGDARPWPDAEPPAVAFVTAWREAWGDAPLPHLLWLTHPSAQNMSPYARRETAFHTRMLDARAALRSTAQRVLGWALPRERPQDPTDGIYALPEWRDRIAPRHLELDQLWRTKGV